MPRAAFLLLAAPSLILALGLGAARAAAPTPSDPRAMMQAFVRAYWDPQARYFYTYSDQKTHPEHGAGPVGGLYSDFWWEAQLFDLVMDAHEATGDPAYRAMIGAVWDGFLAAYPDFANDYNDDLGWWAQGAIRAYGLTGERRYLDASAELEGRIWQGWDNRYGGGLWWRRSVKDQKNVATNAPYVNTCVRLYQATGDGKYLDRAQKAHAWVKARLVDGPRVYDHVTGAGDGTVTRWDFTYNFGNFVLASLALRDATGDASYLTDARRAMDWALANLTQNGILLDEGANDGGGFKGVTVRALRRLAGEPGGEKYLAALRDQGASAWNARRADGLVGTAWDAVPSADALQSLAAGSAVAAVLNAGAQPARIPWKDGRYEAENARNLGVDAASRAPGHSGRGYVGNFRSFGQGVAFDVNAPGAGTYRVTLRYGAGGGIASRQLVLNGVGKPVNFAATQDWTTWGTVGTTVTLPPGPSRLTVLFGADDYGWLTLDSLTLEAAP
ncbi:glycoside hydrolase family 76 protein [Deinococcus budaensis]|uniref:Putative alpha-1,6-mannanase (GH76 family) n=1 Tax=Deinococcus budaensis TaxID=1665626 RepID=A0A7W8GI75_9DEIO|nr:glycoside hydrolase family 76 protein [Deinococcus budaensis]MBB5235933.1 putative alpha-1,6-mannanase (GH76 family) [Deinococcus budaensis]